MKNATFTAFLASLEQAAAHAAGDAVPGLRVHPAPAPAQSAADIIAIRQRAGLTRKQFAAILGTAVGTLRKWEDGTHAPSGAARTLQLVLRRNPKVVLEALAA